MRNGPPREICGSSPPEPEKLSQVSGAHEGVALGPSALEATRPAAAVDDDAAWFLSVLRTAPLQTETRRGTARGSVAVDPCTAQTQPAAPAVLELPHEQRVVRTAVRGDSSCDRLTRLGCECDLGSPVQENCTPGSAWGDGYKEPCRLGEGTAPKEAAPARLRQGYRSKACPYQPWAFPRMACEVRRASGGRPARRAAHPEMVAGRRAGGWEANTDGRRDAPRRKCHSPYAKGNFDHLADLAANRRFVGGPMGLGCCDEW